jgi:peroxiredoxin
MQSIKFLFVIIAALAVGAFTSFTADRPVVSAKRSVVKATPQVGQKAPDIELPGLDGKPVRLSSLKGNVVLLDFWASWCGPCRKENPYTVEIFNEYKDKGFTVFSVSLDQSKDKWKKAIAADELSWPYHVSDLKGWYSKAALLYNIEAIPATYLIDRDGTIIAIDLRSAELEKQLKKIFKQKS